MRASSDRRPRAFFWLAAALLILVAGANACSVFETARLDDVAVATDDQDAMELQAARLLRHPKMRQASRVAADYWLETLGALTPELMTRFETAMDEMTMSVLLYAIASDPLNPRIVTTLRPAHRVAGTDIPGSRSAIDNPDTIYRWVPVDSISSYVISGVRVGRGASVNEFSVLDRSMTTLASMSGRDLDVASDGTFTLSVGPEAAAGRSNHLQTGPGADRVLIRDTLGDWAVERPNLLSIKRIGAANPTMPLADDDVVERASATLLPYVRDVIRYIGLSFEVPVNEFPAPIVTRNDGFLATQSYSLGHFLLTADEALVITVDPGEADYVTVPINNLFGTSNDPIHRLASLNNRQADSNPDGSFTVVIAHDDPGYFNWIDPEGLEKGLVSVRWAGFPRGAEETSAIDARLVEWAALDHAVPTTMRRVSRAERQEQLAARSANYARRTTRVHW